MRRGRTPTAASGRHRPGYEDWCLNTPASWPTGRMTDPRQGTLNPIGVNCLRTFPGIGTVVFGARTLVAANTAFPQYRVRPGPPHDAVHRAVAAAEPRAG